MLICLVISGVVSDVLQKRHLLSTTNVRKLMNAFGQSVSLHCLVVSVNVNSILVWLCDCVECSAGVEFLLLIQKSIPLPEKYPCS